VTLSAGLAGAALARAAPAAAVSAAFVKGTVEAAALFAARCAVPAGAVSPNVVALTEGVLQMLWVNKVKAAGVALVLCAAAATGVGLAAYGVLAAERPGAPAQSGGEPKRDAEPARPLAKEALRYGDKSFEEWRIALMTDLKPEVRIEAIRALSAFGANGYGAEAARVIVQALRAYGDGDEDDWKVVEAGKKGLRKIGPDAVPLLVEELKKGAARGRRFALGGLAEVGTEAAEALPAVVEAVKDRDATVRAAALSALDLIDREGEHVAAVADLLAAGEPPVVDHALNYLAGRGAKAKAAAPKILAFIRHGRASGRRAQAINALRQIEADVDVVLPALIEALGDENARVREHAAFAFQDLKLEEKKGAVAPLLAAWKKAKDLDHQLAVVGALGVLGPAAAEAVPALTQWRDTDAAAKSRALRDAVTRALQSINR
jgi:HEAT repeat protein